jgi:hypothetical protein
MSVAESELMALEVGTVTAVAAMRAVTMERERMVGLWF